MGACGAPSYLVDRAPLRGWPCAGLFSCDRLDPKVFRDQGFSQTLGVGGRPWPNHAAQQKGAGMAKKIQAYVKLQVPAGKANPSPPIGPALGQQGVNIMEFCKQFNARTQKMEA